MRKINRIITLVTATFLLSVASCSEKAAQKADYNIIPLPLEINKSEGKSFILSSSTKILFPEGNEKMNKNAEFLSEYLNQSNGISLKTTTSDVSKNVIALSLEQFDTNPEAYKIVVDEAKISIIGTTEAAVFLGIQNLRKSLPLDAKTVEFEPVAISDKPRYEYRGVMLDVARHFESAEFVKKFIDILALHNINKFHWHLTEDQGWRIEIKKYPKLTEIGSKRSETVVGKNTGEYNGTPHQGFYTQEEIKDIIKYAEDRYITIIPEIDLPGHMLAALAAYPEFGCTGGPYEVAKTWGVFDDVLCPGNEKTFEFIEDVLAEIVALFPSKYIHIGGDECPKVRWEKCPKCQARIKELGIKGDKEHKPEHFLQSYVTERVEAYLNGLGRDIIGWDEILEGKLAPNATVMSWRGTKGGIEAAKQKHDVIMTPNDFCYFDHYQSKDQNNEPFAIGGYLPVEKVYSFNPNFDELTPEENKHILGVQANLWTEYVPNPEHAEYMLLPRIAALSEVQWTAVEKKNYDDFVVRLKRLLGFYDKFGYNYAKHILNDAEIEK